MSRKPNAQSMFLVFLTLAFFLLSTSAFALDRRLKLLFKTAGYGAAAGLVIGAGTMALGMGDYKNMLMGASSGMYAGILLAGYIMATPNDHSNPYESRSHKPEKVGPDQWRYEPQDENLDREHLPPDAFEKKDEESKLNLFDLPVVASNGTGFVAWWRIVELNF